MLDSNMNANHIVSIRFEATAARLTEGADVNLLGHQLRLSRLLEFVVGDWSERQTSGK